MAEWRNKDRYASQWEQLFSETIKEFMGFLNWYYSDCEKHKKIVDEKIKNFIKELKEDDGIGNIIS